jgi:hypothetical protein
MIFKDSSNFKIECIIFLFPSIDPHNSNLQVYSVTVRFNEIKPKKNFSSKPSTMS